MRGERERDRGEREREREREREKERERERKREREMGVLRCFERVIMGHNLLLCCLLLWLEDREAWHSRREVALPLH